MATAPSRRAVAAARSSEHDANGRIARSPRRIDEKLRRVHRSARTTRTRAVASAGPLNRTAMKSRTGTAVPSTGAERSSKKGEAHGPARDLPAERLELAGDVVGAAVVAGQAGRPVAAVGGAISASARTCGSTSAGPIAACAGAAAIGEQAARTRQTRRRTRETLRAPPPPLRRLTAA
jgi:hypothetical protein